MREDLKKLPKWAREEIGYLNMRIDELVRERNRLAGCLWGKGSPISFHNGFDEKGQMLYVDLPPDTIVRFRHSDDPGDYTTVSFQGDGPGRLDDSRDRVLTIMGSGRIAVYPASSNVAHIKNVDRE